MITQFKGEYAWLSNFWPILICFEGRVYPSVEHAYQAAKVHPSLRAQFCTGSPEQAKKLGRTVQLPGCWEHVKVSVMRGLIADKFSYKSDLASRLVCTGSVTLTEGNWWKDTFWGVCRGKGQNMLGHLLMDRRLFLQGLT